MDASKNEDIAPVKWSKKRKIGFWASVIFVLCCTIGAILPPILTRSSKTTPSTTTTTPSTTTTSKTTISTSKTTTTMQTSQSTEKTKTTKEDTTTMITTEESKTTAINSPPQKFGHICKDYDGDGCNGRYMTYYDGYLYADNDALMRNASVVLLDNEHVKFGIVDPEYDNIYYAYRFNGYEDGAYIETDTNDHVMSYFDDYQFGDGNKDQWGSAFDSDYGFGQTPQDTAVTMPQAAETSQWAPVAPMNNNTSSSFNTNSHFSPVQAAPLQAAPIQAGPVTPVQALPAAAPQEHVEIYRAPILRSHADLVIDPEMKLLYKLQEKFRAEKGADIQLRKERLYQFLLIIQSRDINFGDRPASFPLTAANFREASPSFVSYVIGGVLPGVQQDLAPCANSSYDDRLYQFPVEKTFCGDKPMWDETKPPSEEDMMIMEVTGWSKEQLYAGMKEVQTALTYQYNAFMIIRCAAPFVFFIWLMMALNGRDHNERRNDQWSSVETYRVAPIEIDDNENILHKIQKKFRADEFAHLRLRKERLRQFLQIIQSRDIEMFPQIGNKKGPPKFPLTTENFIEASSSFVAFVIHEVFPGDPANNSTFRISNRLCYPGCLLRVCCCWNSHDDRLYQYPVKATFCGIKSAWDETMPLSDENRMIMEITGWSKDQLYNGMTELQEKSINGSEIS
ncbi:Oidioi.mRNA.OKI2018_I69.PAR.g9879.t1.cds [Oikopleura dioica]|uniref:Oidioi.mRNA.OKI2018_I69.PAR.g9879.t1.cds n=1 Tax=Oikopleura dioica TaxID=34765 RepID=A0ABN7RNN7_OIKDI|nr:Oidioi.mRNA.OKI2018_I69.PAR.g9879.t1.cds [Oikopleura dioica]